MKITCDICNGELKMAVDGQSATCINCGVSYPLERLKEKLVGKSNASQDVINEPASAEVPANEYEISETPAKDEEIPEAEWIPVEEYDGKEHYLRIKRKIDLFLCNIVVLIDGNKQYALKGQGKETVIPITCGKHSIEVLVQYGLGKLESTAKLDFTVGICDWCGEVGLVRGAFKAHYEFKMWELK